MPSKSLHSYILYNHWANETLTSWLNTVDPALLYKDANSSFASIDLTLQHMKNAQNFWYAVIAIQDINKLDETIKINAFDLVVEDLLAGSKRMIAVYAAFSDEELMTHVAAPALTKSRYDFVLHVINHNSYHRGQIITIIRWLGVTEDIPNTDYDTYLWMSGNDSTL